ncbi:MAG: hypothetical protein GF317_08480 [Candidatus Lokiarchaeota archaeon]|nr:hypothetical protein [Candidatus Lokiarchaeota archaeon]
MVGQVIAFIAAFYVAIVIFKKDISYIGKKLFIISFILFGSYASVVFLYEFPISILVNEILIRASLLLIVAGILFFVLSMQVFAQSSVFLEKTITKILILISIIVCILTFIFPYRVLHVQPIIEADKNIISLLATGIWSFILMIYNSIQLFKVLKELENSIAKVKLKIKYLLIAQLIGLISPTMSIIGNITKNSYLHALMFIFLAIPIIMVGFLISKENEEKK